jgi:lysophospholipid hydrolase
VRDLTFSDTSVLSGRRFNESIQKIFGDINIEDLWLPYFCITTDLSALDMGVHTRGK